jgi:tRNA A-37 threonylcarbamoyl transferase component Bud32
VEDRLFSRRYRVVERIGSGGMAEVFKAKDEVLGRTVALKVLHRQFADDANFVARFRQEAQAAANLSHPNIVNIYDWGRDEDDYYIVMELIRGIDLKTLVERRGSVDPFESAEYGAQVAAALNAAHGYGVVHRDIKPHNIVLTGEGTVKVTDFGIARAGDTSMTQTGSVLGTAQYISPEQAQGRPLGPQADIYSLGVVLYELTTGRVPFEGDQPITIALKQVNEEPVPPRDIDPSIPEAMEAVILRAMRKDPADRYPSADEMRRDLKRVAAGQPVETPEPRVDRTTVMPAAPVERPDRYQEPRRPSRRRRPWGWIVAGVVLLALLGVGAAYTLGGFGEEEVTVPTVVGLTSEEATATLRTAGLAPGEVTLEYSDSVAPGVVMGQDPAAGTTVPASSTVDTVVSRGVETATVPDLVDMPEADAIRALRDAGFELAVAAAIIVALVPLVAWLARRMERTLAAD